MHVFGLGGKLEYPEKTHADIWRIYKRLAKILQDPLVVKQQH